MKSKTLFLLILLSGFMFSATQQTSVQVMVNVKSFFELAVDRNLIDFKTMNPGEMKRDMPDNEGVKVNIKSNSGTPWFLKISDMYELTNGKDVISNGNFVWYGYPSKTALGTWYGNGEDKISLSPALAYSSNTSEYNNLPNGTDLFFKFALKIPPKQNSGLYRSIVAFTLTE
ncbi:MAG: hypothetical protein PHV30_03940 [Candidatus Margulisbacteria bacterium]|nr:hypothetical protein [Candidatus Margulisiibacteriota bacterium]